MQIVPEKPTLPFIALPRGESPPLASQPNPRLPKKQKHLRVRPTLWAERVLYAGEAAYLLSHATKSSSVGLEKQLAGNFLVFFRSLELLEKIFCQHLCDFPLSFKEDFAASLLLTHDHEKSAECSTWSMVHCTPCDFDWHAAAQRA